MSQPAVPAPVHVAPGLPPSLKGFPMIRLAVLAGVVLGLVIATYAVAPVQSGTQVSTQRVLRGRWGSTPGLPPSGGYCAE